MQADDFETAIKVVVVGNGNVGKSSLIRRFCKSEYIQNYKKTIGVEYQERDLVLKNNNNERVKIMVWDCAGQEEFDTITKDYYKEADAVILAFSTVDRQSFEMVKGWRNKLAAVLSMTDVTAVLIQNKCDMIEEALVNNAEAEALARELKIRFYRISVKNNENIEDVFVYLAETHLKKKRDRLAAENKKRTAIPNTAMFIKDQSTPSPANKELSKSNTIPVVDEGENPTEVAPNQKNKDKKECIIS